MTPCSMIQGYLESIGPAQLEGWATIVDHTEVVHEAPGLFSLWIR